MMVLLMVALLMVLLLAAGVCGVRCGFVQALWVDLRGACLTVAYCVCVCV